MQDTRADGRSRTQEQDARWTRMHTNCIVHCTEPFIVRPAVCSCILPPTAASCPCGLLLPPAPASSSH